MGGVPMRHDCRHYETRTYASGEVVHMCRLDLAPEAPWRCPSDCPKFQRRGFDAGWTQGSLARKAVPPDPPRLDADAAALLDQAEEIVNAVGPEILEEVERQREAALRPQPFWRKLKPRLPRRRGRP
jgi:hypothetical protein